ncbi:MAG TPA: M3 family metallopeptidase, partial [Thermoanaerobaculia bacterium]|nr:M3 family metallopeptidase [Thermoanaerobaculia bacterium]
NAEVLRKKPKIPSRQFQIDSIVRWRDHTLSGAPPETLELDQLPRDRDVLASALIRLAAARTAYARKLHFHDAASWTYFGSYWTRAEVDSLLKRVERSADLYKRYQRMEKPAVTPPQFTIEESTRILLDATAPLGPDYTRELAALLDPANGRMDILPGPHRRSGGFSEGAPGVDSVFYSAGFTGSYNDVRVLMHESTHAIQRQLMNAAHVPVAYRSGPNFLAEGLAIFNELVLADYMASHATDPEMRQFYLRQFLDGKGMIAFVVAPEAELEERVYDGVAAGTIRTAADLDRLTESVYSKFSINPDPQRWMSIRLMYEDPFYDINYVYGGIVGLRLYAMYRRDAAAFAPKYVAMMRNGYTAPPNALLRKFFGFDLNDPLEPVFALLRERIHSTGDEER